MTSSSRSPTTSSSRRKTSQTLQKDVTELSDRVDQVEKAQEEAAAGGP